MKRIAIVLLLIGAMAAPAVAGQIQVGYSGSTYGPYSTGSGGEFTFNPINPAGWLNVDSYGAYARDYGVTGTFQTFCLEGKENLSGYPYTYDAKLNFKAVEGGVGPAGDTLSVGTGWLYKQFATNIWEAGLSYGYTSGRLADALLLQYAIWWLEDEKGVSYNALNPYMKGAVDKFGSEAAAKVDGAWDYGVYAVNMWTTDNAGVVTNIQDGIFYTVPDGGTTLMLLGGVLMGLGALRRRFRQ